MKNLQVIFFLLLILSACESTPSTRPDHDWADITIDAQGFAPISDWSLQERIIGIQQAKKASADQLEKKIMTLKTDSGKTLSEMGQKDEKIRKKITAYLGEAEIIKIENKPDGVRLHSRLFLGNQFKLILDLLPRKELTPSGRQDQAYPQRGSESRF